MHDEIIFDATKIFGLVLKKIKTMFCVVFFGFFSKVEGSLQKNHILMMNMRIK